jgi:hypothetical protein
MQNASRRVTPWAVVAVPMLQLERQFGVSRLKRRMLAMLAAWLGYFAIVSMSIGTLNTVTVPWLNLPLGLFLVAQGALVIFLAALILLVKTSGRPTR